MIRFSQIILVALALMYLVQAQAMVNFDSGISACPVFAEDDKKDGDVKDGKKKDGKKKDGKKGDEEPECD